MPKFMMEAILFPSRILMACLAIKAFLRMNGHANKAAPPTGHLSVWFEEITLPPAMK